ncbi:putative bifunctional diguanylate cyclase/phosphodiesterase [Pseudopontixanthobacter vadosimaris]|uniref:putative bifunctional diguanylate cyclase/phosphodiesterase n=1 Tax=Pseudopontixanthobacter vadosimaris TaxID=2726450 RepID=UPI001472F30C|nr:EAL domain-containing protein [Pseudopontixanthobacter vadosimaris]
MIPTRRLAGGRWRFTSLSRRIAVLYTLLFGIVLAAIMMLVNQGIQRFAENSAARDLAANARVFDEILELRARQMRGSADVLSRDFGFREAVATDDAATIGSALANLQSRSSASAAFIVGLDGSVAGSGQSALTSAESMWSALDEGQERGVIEIGGKLALAAASPVEAPDLLGWLVLAQPLDAAEMARLGRLAALGVDAKVRARGALPGAIGTLPLGEVAHLDTDDEQLYRVSALPSLAENVEPRLVLRHSLQATLAEYTKLRLLLGLFAGVGLALVIVLSGRIAGSIARPIGKLDRAARAMGQGRARRVPVDSDDEVGRLAISFNQMVDAIEDREERITHVALHDGLTNLPNRKLFVEQLQFALERRHGDERIMVVYVDLDDFKVVNDTLGHPVGDALLCRIADNLKTCIPDVVVARMGGDEFGIMLNRLGPGSSIPALADSLQACFGQGIEIDGQLADASASLGIAIAPADGVDSETLMKHADLALYRAKREGKGTHHFFETALDEQAQKRRRMELDLRTAIREGQFEMNFQPLYSPKEDRLKAFEALIRWPHPELGMISPAEFIPLAEETGLIIPIGEWVLRESCRQAAAWPDDLSVAVNVSPKQFTTPNLPAVIMQALTTSGLAPQRLELEITESIFIANVDATLATLHRLRDLGVRIALDDFGTGYSSLSYLRSFPFDKLKIDQSFVDDLLYGGNSGAVIRAIIALADALGMETLAEGVEEQVQADILAKEGCRQIQGYLLSRPMHGAAVADFIGSLYGQSWKHSRRA